MSQNNSTRKSESAVTQDKNQIQIGSAGMSGKDFTIKLDFSKKTRRATFNNNQQLMQSKSDESTVSPLLEGTEKAKAEREQKQELSELGNEIDKRLYKQFIMQDQLKEKFQEQIKPGQKIYKSIKGIVAASKK